MGKKKRAETKKETIRESETEGKRQETKSYHIFSISLILIISIAIYSNTLKNGFVYDDEFTIVNNTLIKNFSNISKLFTKEYFTTSAEMSYRPVVTSTYFIDYALYGLKPWGYHLTNLILHAINGVILYIFLTLLITHHSSLITLISLLFITHPVLTEAVNAISFREDLLCFLFFISALILYISLKAQSSKLKATTFSYILSCLFYFLALLSKEMAITFPLIIILYEWVYGKKIELSPAFLSLQKGSPQTSPPLQKGRVRVGYFFNPYIIGYIAITIAYLCIRFYLFKNPIEETLHAWLLSERLITLPYLILKYIVLLIAPVSLSADYVIAPVQSLISLKFIIPFIIVSVLVSVSVNSVRASKTQSPVTSHQLPNPPQSPFTKGGLRGIIVFGIFFFLLTLLPVYNIIPITNPFTERYLYLPSVGFVIIAGLVIHGIFTPKIASPIRGEGGGEGWLLKRRNLYILTVSVLILSIYSFAVIQRNKIWADGYSLWSDTVIKMPESSKAHYSLGNAYNEQGRLNEAIEEFQTALRLTPDYVEAHNNLGVAYFKQGRLNEAIEEYHFILRFKDLIEANNLGDVYNNLGNVYNKQGLLDEAIKEYRMAISIKPDYAEAHNNLGVVYAKHGQLDEAIKEYRMAIFIKPDYAEAHNNLGLVYWKHGQLDEAIKEYRMAISIKPDYAEAHNNLGLVYWKHGQLDEAIKEYRMAISIKPDYTEAHNNLGVVYEKNGQFDEAIKEYRMAIKINPDLYEAYNNLGNIYINQEKLDEAIKEYLTALRLKPDYAYPYNNLGFVYYKQGRLDDAINKYLTAIRLKPDFAITYRNLGLVYIKQSKLDEAIDKFLTALKLNPDDAIAHYNLGLVYNMKGLKDRAIDELEFALSLKPDYIQAKQLLESLKRR